jgi:uncharacterized protein (DUF305 family)
MRKRVFVLLTLGLVGLILAGCGSNSSDNTGSKPSAAKTSSAHNNADVQFAQMMIAHHQQAIEMAKLAPSRASSDAVKTLATDIEGAQGPEIAKMTGWLKAWGKPVSDGMGGMDMGHDSMPGLMSDKDMTMLKGMRGKEFDKQFLTMMIAHHQGAITMARQEQKDGTAPDAIALAKSIASSQTAQITQMRKLVTGNAG